MKNKTLLKKHDVAHVYYKETINFGKKNPDLE